MLEELDAQYVLRPIDIGKGDQYAPTFTAINPNNRVPAIVDPVPLFGNEPFPVFESGAILVYLADKFGKLLPDDAAARYQCLQWLFWQVGGLGPMGGQAHHFRLYAKETIDYAVSRYTNECRRLYGVMEQRLESRQYLAGEYSIADIACLPWIYRHERQGIALEDFPALAAWYQRLFDRPAVNAGMTLAAELRDDSAFITETGRRILFGDGRTRE